MLEKAFKYTPEDVLVGIYFHFPKNVNEYNYGIKKFHEFFYGSMLENGCSVFSGMTFNGTKGFYMSPELASAREKLLESNLLAEDGDFDVFNSSDIRTRWKEFTKKKFDISEKCEIILLSDDFVKEFC